MKFEKLSLDKFDSCSLPEDTIFKIVGGAETTYECVSGCSGGGTDTLVGNATTIHSGPIAPGDYTDVKIQAVNP